MRYTEIEKIGFLLARCNHKPIETQRFETNYV